MPWHDVHSDTPGGAWLGVEYVAAPRSSEPPYLHMEAASPSFMRLMAGSTPLVWARIDPDHCGYWYLRPAASPQVPPPIIPPFTAAAARKVGGKQGSAPWYAAWSRVILRNLESSRRTPFHSGRWRMIPCPTSRRDDPGWCRAGGPWPSVPLASYLDRLPTQPSHDYSEWNYHEELPPLALRPLSAEDDGRVKAWRRAFREGRLPPVLMLWVSGLHRYVILDGHDRLLAALLEGHTPPMFALLPLIESARDVDLHTREAATETVENLLLGACVDLPRQKRPLLVELGNRLLIDAHDDRPKLEVISRAWPLRGGVRAWLDEVRTELQCSRPAGEVFSEMLARTDAT